MALHKLREAVGGDKHGALSILRTQSLSLEELEVGKFVSTVYFYLLISYFSLTPQILEYCIYKSSNLVGVYLLACMRNLRERFLIRIPPPTMKMCC